MSRPFLKNALLACAGAAAVVTLASGLTAPSEAAISALEVIAGLDETKWVCRRPDEPLWTKKRSYGCGQIRCEASSRLCQVKQVKSHKPRQPNCPPTIACVPTEKKDGDHPHDVVQRDAQARDRGNDGPNGSRSPGVKQAPVSIQAEDSHTGSGGLARFRI